jgi:CO/xanthine dehydrogenase FAD-binding subunit
MRPAAFEYHRAETLEHALTMLAEFGDEGRPLAGGQSLIPMMNLRLARPQHLVDINGLGLDAIERDRDLLRIGALVRHERYVTDPLIAEHLPAFLDAVQCIGHPTIRRHGSLAGSLAHADPTAELPLLCMLYDARIVARSVAGERRIAAGDFFKGAYMTALQPGEMITAVEVPAPHSATAGAFVEMAERRGDFAIAAGAVSLGFENGRITRASAACSGSGQCAIRVPSLEDALVGRSLAAPAATEAIEAFSASLTPPDDHSATADYRRALIKDLLTGAIALACARAMEAS